MEGTPVLRDVEIATWPRVREAVRLQPVFQPIVDLAHGRVTAYEALSRPKLESRKRIAILDVVESARLHGPGAEVEFDAMAVGAITARALDLPTGMMLFVNVSPATVLENSAVLQPLSELPCRVVLEVTERSQIPDAQRKEFLHALDLLRWRGFLIAVDDCGAGYSGLTRLVSLRPDFAKVDMELVRGVDHDSAKAQLVEALFSFARRAGISVIAEGVETEAELQTLAELGAGYAQGYLLGRPARRFARVPRYLAPAEIGLPARADAAVALGSSIRLARMAARGLGDAPGLYEAIVDAACKATGADIAILRRRVNQTLVPVATAGVPEQPLSISTVSQDPIAAGFRAGRPVLRQSRSDGRRGSPYGSTFGAPVFVDGSGWGMLSIGFYPENSIRGELVDLATGLADLAGLILAANQGGMAPSQTEVIDALRYFILHPGDITDALARVIRDVERATGSHDCWIGMVEADRFQIISGNGEVTPTRLADWLDPESESGQMPPGVALREARPVIVDDIREDPSLASQLEGLLAQAIISAAAIPMSFEERIVGILKVYHSTVAAFSPEQLNFLEDVADVLGRFIGLEGPQP